MDVRIRVIQQLFNAVNYGRLLGHFFQFLSPSINCQDLRNAIQLN